MKPKRDKYKSARGGESKLLEISCGFCGAFICTYQKDGPGALLRMYFDRISGLELMEGNLACAACGKVIGVPMVYKKESRMAYRLFQGSVAKKQKERQ